MKSKKFLLAMIILILSLFLSSCSLLDEKSYAFLDSDHDFSDKTFAKLIDSINSKDEVALKSLFAANVQNSFENFDDSVNQLINFFKSENLTFERTNGVGSTGEFEDGKKMIELIATYNVTSKKYKYYIRVSMTKYNTFDENNSGMLSLYIINAKDWKENSVYGVSEDTPGIHIVSDY